MFGQPWIKVKHKNEIEYQFWELVFLEDLWQSLLSHSQRSRLMEIQSLHILYICLLFNISTLNWILDVFWNFVCFDFFFRWPIRFLFLPMNPKFLYKTSSVLNDVIVTFLQQCGIIFVNTNLVNHFSAKLTSRSAKRFNVLETFRKVTN